MSDLTLAHLSLIAHSSGPIGPGAAVRQGTSARYYGEVWIMPVGSRSESERLIGVGPGRSELPRNCFGKPRYAPEVESSADQIAILVPFGVLLQQNVALKWCLAFYKTVSRTP